MAILTGKGTTQARRIRRMALMLFFVGCVVTVMFVVLATNAASGGEAPLVVERGIGALIVVTVERAIVDGGSSSSMSFGWGTLVLLVGLPAAGALVAALAGRRVERSTPPSAH